MWAQYRKTFWPIQAIIFAVTLAVYFGLGHILPRAIVFFVIMEVGAIVGAVWAVRLKSMVLRAETQLPLQKRARVR